MKKFLFLGAALLSTSFSVSSYAENRYVSDVVYIALRSDKDPQASIVQRSIVSGTKLSFIKEEMGTDKNLWALVVTPDGKEGWVRSYSLTSEPTAATKLANLPASIQEAAKVQAENLSLKQQLEKLQNEHQLLLTDTKDMRQAATTSLNLEEENKRIHTEFQLLQTERDMLKAENERLNKTDRFHQWVYGGGLILGGVLLSFILQAFGRRKRHSEWR